MQVILKFNAILADAIGGNVLKNVLDNIILKSACKSNADASLFVHVDAFKGISFGDNKCCIMKEGVGGWKCSLCMS